MQKVINIYLQFLRLSSKIIYRVCPRKRFLDPPGPPPPLLSILYKTIYFQQIYYHLFFCYLGLGQDTFWAERCGHRLGQLRHSGPSAAATGQVKSRHFLSDPCTKLIGGGGGPKIVLQEYTYFIIHFDGYVLIPRELNILPLVSSFFRG